MSFPKKGKSFPKRRGGSNSNLNLDDHAFAMKIAAALQAELKDQNSRAKISGGMDRCQRTHGQKLDVRTVRPMWQAPCAIGSPFGSGAECHFVDGGSTGSASGSEGRGYQAKGF
jgi:hypothetical protein